jgi:hypothetical protein
LKQLTIHSLILLIPLILVGCAPSSPIMQPTHETQSPKPTHLLAPDTIFPTYTFLPGNTELPLPTNTHPPFTTLNPEIVIKTMQPLLEDPFNCSVPCFMGITPGKTTIEQVKAFYGPLGFRQREGKANINTDKQYYSVGYEDVIKRNSNVTFLYTNSIIENIEITPEIPKPKEGVPREWTGYSPETFIRKYGQPSRVEFAVDWDPIITVTMILFYDDLHLVALYSGFGMYQGHPHSIRLCPLTAPFDYIGFYLGPKSGNPPLFSSVPLEKATSLTVDQFAQLLIQNPRDACITLNGDALQ